MLITIHNNYLEFSLSGYALYIIKPNVHKYLQLM